MPLDLESHLTRQMVFSRATFGPGERSEGVIDHIRKELDEIEAGDGDAAEWVDLVILALDGLTRRLWASTGPAPAQEMAAMACRMIVNKQSRNELRDWPDWRTADPTKAIEHDRSKEGGAE